MVRFILLCFLVVFSFYGSISAQNVAIEGYAFEEGNRGFISNVKVSARDKETSFVFDSTFTNIEGFFALKVPQGRSIDIMGTNDLFENQNQLISTVTTEKQFLSFKMKRLPGYVFEITMAEKKEKNVFKSAAITGAMVEVYNNTKNEVVLALDNHPDPVFKVNLVNGNHYTVLIRKQGYLAKQMEAYVNVNGCIMCFEGIGDITPGVVDNLTENNQQGLLLANVELDPLYLDKRIVLNDIYYELNKAELTEDSKKELSKVAFIAKSNPHITFEIGSHTDSRGSTENNQILSNKRSEAVVRYLINKLDVRKSSLNYQGYGESQLVNECKDGVVCSEEKHANNRRTELRIISVDTLVEFTSLEEMKRIERLENEILSITYGNTAATHNADISTTTISSVETKTIEGDDGQVTNAKFFRLRCGIFRTKKYADLQMGKLNKLGYKATISQDKSKMYRVIVGEYQNKADAEKNLKYLIAKGFSTVID